MNFLGNLIWLIFGGFFAALGYFFGGIILCLTIIGIPFGLQCFKLAGLVLWPFGKKVVSDSSQSGCLSVLANIIWIIFGGIEVALTHLIMGAFLYITIIGIPWGRQHFKLLEISLLPFGKRVVDAP
ncbi:YccF domain-containing protein [Lacibacter sediminis]|uniref:YccF domain-containing protein n=1 Tax=Lacibacter sediminis TaxID=2760713 RepID=A0A7G5XKN2_9BACT|nr:YccF domain-containing protein [Lacibacter sediminis]QNA46035.1 YccF domain-containing protein [Lacibacter sediminis]